jgi:pyruvate-formate lyase-activating enzyme
MVIDMGLTIMERLDRHTHVPAEKLVSRPTFPDAIKIEITSRCNYSCSYCASKRHLRPQGDMNREFLYRILHEAHSIGVREIGMFLLGESLLVKELPEYVKYAKDVVGIEYVFLTTNGSLASPEKLAELVDAGIDSIKFSVNAGSSKRYLEIHGVDAFDRVVENIVWLNDYKLKHSLTKPRISVSSIFVEEYREETEALHSKLSHHIDDFYLLPLYNQGGHVGGVVNSKIVGNPGRLENMVSPIPCWAIFNSARISWNGWLTACCFDHDTRFEMADLNKVSLLEAWHHPRFIELRAAHLSGVSSQLGTSLCKNCLCLDQ